jgi:hypothetical protein
LWSWAPPMRLLAGTPARETHTFSRRAGSSPTLANPGAVAGGDFGLSVAIDAAGTVFVGAPLDTGGGHDFAGQAFVFDSSGTLTYTLTSPNAQDFGGLGEGFDGVGVVSSNAVVVSAASETAGGYTSAGHAYIFSSSATTNVPEFPLGLFGFLAMIAALPLLLVIRRRFYGGHASQVSA